jgi:flagellar biosynthetic protein FliR
MGFNMGEVMDPSAGRQSSVVGELYFMFTLTIFLLANGHHAVLRGLYGGFKTLPPMSVALDRPMFDAFTGLLGACTSLALQLAAPVLLTMVVVEVALGLVGRTMPQLNALWAGVTLRTALGLVVLIAGLSLTSRTVLAALRESIAGLMSPLGRLAI